MTSRSRYDAIVKILGLRGGFRSSVCVAMAKLLSNDLSLDLGLCCSQDTPPLQELSLFDCANITDISGKPVTDLEWRRIVMVPALL